MIFESIILFSIAVGIHKLQSLSHGYELTEGGAIRKTKNGYQAYKCDGTDLIQIQPGRTLRTRYAAMRSIQIVNQGT